MEEDDINKIVRPGKPEQKKSRPMQIVMEEVEKKAGTLQISTN